MRGINGRRCAFIVGCPRSGTTLLQSMLAAHPRISSFTESHFFSQYFRKRRLLPGYRIDSALVERIGTFLQENAIGTEVGAGPAGRITPFTCRWAPSHWVARQLIDLLDRSAGARGTEVWIEKTPAHLRRMDLIEGAARPLVDVRFIHMVREGTQTVASLYRASREWGGGRSIEECVQRWNEDQRITLNRVTRNAHRHAAVIYQDLVKHPEPVLESLLAWLGLAWSQDVVEKYAQTATELITPEERWKAATARPLGLSDTTSRTLLSPAEREYMEHHLESDLYHRLRQLSRLHAQQEDTCG